MDHFWDGFSEQSEKTAGPVTAIAHGLGRVYGGASRMLQSGKGAVTSARQSLRDMPSRAHEAFLQGTIKRGPAAKPVLAPRVSPKVVKKTNLAAAKAKAAPPATTGKVEPAATAPAPGGKPPLTGWRRDGNKLLAGGMIGAGGMYLAGGSNDGQSAY